MPHGTEARRGSIDTLAEPVADGTLTIEQAAGRMGLAVDAFQEAVEALKKRHEPMNRRCPAPFCRRTFPHLRMMV